MTLADHDVTSDYGPEGEGPFQVPISLTQECAVSEDMLITIGRTLSRLLHALAKGSPHGPIYAPVCGSMTTMRASLRQSALGARRWLRWSDHRRHPIDGLPILSTATLLQLRPPNTGCRR
jgi:hypothetical protein